MFGLFKSQNPIVNLTPLDVSEGLKKGEITLIDVREPSEFAAEHIKGAINIPLSRLKTETLPEAKGRTLVMQCLAGGRSAQGVISCRDLGLGVDHHMQGGLNDWKAAGLPTTR
ncbi:rhodanese-like domain-containing protein [Asticcacaulis sp. SL142]|uniref:rhodanese-like domain-containing protein n=1 Tax=Asticcacaulis sp. SL142 TaxID=2995155 RepID=UPI00226D09E1|nr:rhodanese-like domain-containing protein [Asticcacaulis sp. SL142]WAC47606.1 rhodanese-like domain-containing protein [Asticcacaulis sp. SL142]